MKLSRPSSGVTSLAGHEQRLHRDHRRNLQTSKRTAVAGNIRPLFLSLLLLVSRHTTGALAASTHTAVITTTSSSCSSGNRNSNRSSIRLKNPTKARRLLLRAVREGEEEEDDDDMTCREEKQEQGEVMRGAATVAAVGAASRNANNGISFTLKGDGNNNNNNNNATDTETVTTPAVPVRMTSMRRSPSSPSGRSGRRVPLQRRATSLVGGPRDAVFLWSSLVAGVGSGAVASVICAPLDLIRTRLQVWGEVTGTAGKKASAIPAMAGDIFRSEGWTGFFRGLGATLVTVPFFWGVYFPLYGDFKRSWSDRYPGTNPALIHMGSAVAAGAISDLICNPMFVVRTRLQTEALHRMVESGSKGGAAALPLTGILQTARSLYSEGGPLIFWRGMTANLLGLSHVAVQFPVYEKLKKTLKRRHNKRHESALDLLLASGLSKMTACVLTYPHEVIRSRMMDARVRAGFFETCRRIHAAEGWLGFYAGLPVSLVRVLPNTCITFLTYELLLRWAKHKIREHRLRDDDNVLDVGKIKMPSTNPPPPASSPVSPSNGNTER